MKDFFKFMFDLFLGWDLFSKIIFLVVMGIGGLFTWDVYRGNIKEGLFIRGMRTIFGVKNERNNI